MRLIVRWLAILTVLLAAACESAVIEPTPTESSLPMPTLTSTLTAPVTAAPTRPPLAEATAFFGRSVKPGRDTATLRITHSAPQAPALDIYLDGADYALNLGPSLSTGLTLVLPGTYRLEASARGEDTPLAEATITLGAGRTTDVIAVSGADGLQLVVVEGPEEAVEPGTGIVQFVNTLPDSPLEAIINGAALADLIGTDEVSEAVKFDQGDLAISVQSDGVEILAERYRARELTYMLLVLTGTRERPQLLIQQAPLLSRYTLRVINVSEDAREVDVYFDGALVAADLGYGNATARTLYANTPAMVSVHAANADLAVSTPLLSEYAISPRAGSNATLAIYGPADHLQAMWIEDDLSPVAPESSRLMFAHIVPDVRALHAGINSGDIETLQSFAYGHVSSPMTISEGDLRLYFRDAADINSIVELRQALPISGGQSILYFVTGAEIGDETPPLMFEEAVTVNEGETDAQSTPEQFDYRVRFVNAIVSQPMIDIEREGEIVARNLRYGEGTPLISLSEGSLMIRAVMSSSGATVIDEDIGFPRSGDYTIYIVGTPENGITTALIADSLLPPSKNGAQAPMVRLVNLTRDSSAIFGLALMPVRAGGITPVPTAQALPTPDGQSAIDLGRRRVPLGVAVPVSGIKGVSASRQVLGKPGAETYVINQDNEIIATVGSVAYETGTHTDIVVYEYRTATEILATAFAVVYPPR